MQISAVPLDGDSIRATAVRWLDVLLASPDLTGTTFPESIKYYLYVDGIPKRLIYGSWQVTGDHLYLPGRSSQIEPLTRLSILAAIAAITGASRTPSIVEKISQQLVTILNESTKTIYKSIITSPQAPSRLAIDQEHLLVAAEINNTWMLTSGAPVEVTDKWIIMDF